MTDTQTITPNRTPAPSGPRVYVGTYGKYASGSLFGRWLDLDDYADKADFLEACAELHKGEHDPEFMFQDFEGIPEGMISESHVSEELWDWLGLDDDEQELLAVYREHINQEGDIEEARDAFEGTHGSPEAWAEDYIDSCGMLAEMPENLRYYFDYAAYARNAGHEGMTFAEHNGEVWVFHAV